MAVSWRYESRLKKRGFNLIAGVDEAGRGPLAGPVVAAAVILPHKLKIKGLDDSKKLSRKRRERLYLQITERAVSFAIGIVSEKVIDKINILKATHLAMREAVESLTATPDFLIIDGKRKVKGFNIPAQMIPSGDAKASSIAAASIIAKVTRDRIMALFHRKYPVYGFKKHMGYATEEHIEALMKHGPSPIHRKSFEPVASLQS